MQTWISAADLFKTHSHTGELKCDFVWSLLPHSRYSLTSLAAFTFSRLLAVQVFFFSSAHRTVKSILFLLLFPLQALCL